MQGPGITLRQHLMNHLRDRPRLAADLAAVLDQIGFVGRILSHEIRRAAFMGRLGLAGKDNISGEAQKKLDVVANDLAVEAFSGTGLIATIFSEELDEPLTPPGGDDAPFILCIDPIDGSSNTDINGALGTIFGFYRRRAATAQSRAAGSERPLPQGSELIASGFILYGPSTLLAYTAGKGAFAFTLDNEIGEYLLTHDPLRCPARGNYYSANLGRCRDWHPNIRAYLDYVTQTDKGTGRPYSLRYIGALVADLHRSLIDGGIYFYPPDPKRAEGKLRLLYECAPLAFLTEQAGGRASTGMERILDLETRAAHQRAPLVIGSADEVALYESFMKHGKPN